MLMRKVISELNIKNYKILTLDGELPLKPYTKYVIDGKTYDIVPMYDMPNCIAIESAGHFEGKTVEFI